MKKFPYSTTRRRSFEIIIFSNHKYHKVSGKAGAASKIECGKESPSLWSVWGKTVLEKTPLALHLLNRSQCWRLWWLILTPLTCIISMDFHRDRIKVIQRSIPKTLGPQVVPTNCMIHHHPETTTFHWILHLPANYEVIFPFFNKSCSAMKLLPSVPGAPLP